MIPNEAALGKRVKERIPKRHLLVLGKTRKQTIIEMQIEIQRGG